MEKRTKKQVNKKLQLMESKTHTESEQYAGPSKKRKNEDMIADDFPSDFLNDETIRKGMLLLGCITEIHKEHMVLSLPGYLEGIVPLTGISNFVSLNLRVDGDMDILQLPHLPSMFKIGMVFPCKVMKIERRGKKSICRITVSINPQDVNQDLNVKSIFQDMVLYASVNGVEDQAIIFDIGIRGIKGLMHASYNQFVPQLHFGQVIPTCVCSLPKLSHKRKSEIPVVYLRKLDEHEEFPEVEDDVPLTSILPGARMNFFIAEIRYPFVHLKNKYFDACANLVSLGDFHEILHAIPLVHATVLYKNPVSGMIHVALFPKPTSTSFPKYFRIQPNELVNNMKLSYTSDNHTFWEINIQSFGVAKIKQLRTRRSIIVDDDKLSDPAPIQARVSGFHYMDNLLGLDFFEPMDKRHPTRSNIKVGDILVGTVKKHVPAGMWVQITSTLKGFVRRTQMMDTKLRKPEKHFPVGTNMNCRVLSNNKKYVLYLTCKKSLLDLSMENTLQSYNNVVFDEKRYIGVIVNKREQSFEILFFNNCKGIVEPDYFPVPYPFYVGQTVSCYARLTQSFPNPLKLSLQCREYFSVHNAEQKEPEEIASSTNVQISEDTPSCSKSITGSQISKDIAKVPKLDCFLPEDQVKDIYAKVTKVTGNELQIEVRQQRGRVHITQIGCTTEGEFPLKEFSPAEWIHVFIIEECKKPKYRFLKLFRPRSYNFIDCSLVFPPPCSYLKLEVGASVFGFVKEVHPSSVTLWLSPDHTGELPYVHIPEGGGILQKLRHKLKIGQCLKVTVYQVKRAADGNVKITLTKLNYLGAPPFKTNIIGLIKTVSLENGLFLQLPNGYQGSVALTDLQDNYESAHIMLKKFKVQQFVSCKLLEIDWATKHCALSLRISRLYQSFENAHYLTTTCPEIFRKNIVKGKSFNGLITNIDRRHIIVTLGRDIFGKAILHFCTLFNCSLCQNTKDLLLKYQVGSVIQVKVEGALMENTCPVSIAAFKALEAAEGYHEDGSSSDENSSSSSSTT